MSVFAQPDSESEEFFKVWGARPFWDLQELTIMTVSFHISYTVAVPLWGGGRRLCSGDIIQMSPDQP